MDRCSSGTGGGSAPACAAAIDLPTGLRLAPGHLIRVVQQVHERLWAGHVDHGLTSPQYAVLGSLARAPGIDQRALGSHASLDKTSCADVVARLAGRGWLERTRDPQDGRRNLLRLTPEGTRTLADATPRVIRTQERLAGLLAREEHDRLLGTLRRITGAGIAPERRVTAVEIRSRGERFAVPELLWTPGHLIRVVQQVHERLWAGHVDRGLTSPQYAVLLAIHQEPGVDQRALGFRVSLDKTSCADVVARLAGRGWLERTRDPQDGRRNLLRLTPEGTRTLADATPDVARVQRLLLDPLPEEERAVFTGLMARIAYQG
ncbi:MarR family winged helix-turn-helix transcriptional regulator [Allosalinactinospora lopnorensis]|uniref:MarR family winged helix-turn-helix transcriptional regulator n=1 Tax=Allosalinactinospora lopnorensis TaxID=1352348 RepID=UPI000695B693|nr:MarR family transcriptional regulator [Allosalinactinospora lopnorensis]